MTERLLDARGLRCPWPALRLARAMRELPPGHSVRMIVDDAKAEEEIGGLARSNGWRCDQEEKRAATCVFVIRHGPLQ